MSSTPIVTVPSCSSHVSANSYSASAAASFDLESHHYYKVFADRLKPTAVARCRASWPLDTGPELTPTSLRIQELILTAIPGAVFGVLCWVAALLFIVWVRVYLVLDLS